MYIDMDMGICIYRCTLHTHLHSIVYTCMYVHIYIYTNVCMYTIVHMHMCIHTYTQLRICASVHTHMYTTVLTYMCSYTHQLYRHTCTDGHTHLHMWTVVRHNKSLWVTQGPGVSKASWPRTKFSLSSFSCGPQLRCLSFSAVRN